MLHYEGSFVFIRKALKKENVNHYMPKDVAGYYCMIWGV